MVSHFLNSGEQLAKEVGGGLGLEQILKPADAARPTKDLKPSPALSIHVNEPKELQGTQSGRAS
jgi:catalase